MCQDEHTCVRVPVSLDMKHVQRGHYNFSLNPAHALPSYTPAADCEYNTAQAAQSGHVPHGADPEVRLSCLRL